MISRWKAVRLFILCAFISFITNFPAASPSSSLNTAVHELRRFIFASYRMRGFELTEQTELIIRTLILNCWFLAQFIGATTLFSLAERFGRLGAFKLSVAGMGIGNLLQFVGSCTNLPELLFCGRFVSGILSPLCDTCMVMYFQECTPIHLRGICSFLGAIGYGTCTALGMLFGTKLMFGHSIVLLTAVQLPPIALSLIFLYFYLPETPKFLMIVKRDQKEAMKSMIFFQGEKDENVELLEKYAGMETETQSKRKPATLKEIISMAHLRFTILITFAIFIVVLPFFFILQSSTFMFENIGIEPRIAELSSTILFFTYTGACIIGTIFIERFPRRTLILLSGSLSCLFLSLFVLFSSTVRWCEWLKYVSLGVIMCYIITFGMVLSPIAWFISSELSTQRYRSLIFSVCFGLLNVLITATNSICLLAFTEVGSLSFIPLFVIPYVLSLLFLYRYLPETRDKEAFHVAEVIKLMTRDGISAKKAERLFDAQQAKDVKVTYIKM